MNEAAVAARKMEMVRSMPEGPLIEVFCDGAEIRIINMFVVNRGVFYSPLAIHKITGLSMGLIEILLNWMKKREYLEERNGKYRMDEKNPIVAAIMEFSDKVGDILIEAAVAAKYVPSMSGQR